MDRSGSSASKSYRTTGPSVGWSCFWRVDRWSDDDPRRQTSAERNFSPDSSRRPSPATRRGLPGRLPGKPVIYPRCSVVGSRGFVVESIWIMVWARSRYRSRTRLSSGARPLTPTSFWNTQGILAKTGMCKLAATESAPPRPRGYEGFPQSGQVQ